jgi:hypothetical protein
MHKPTRPKLAKSAIAIGSTALLSAIALAVSTGTASAATEIHAKYKVTGSTFLAGPSATLTLGPGTLKATVNASTGAVKATLTLPDATASFNEFGIIPVSATTQFINDGPTTGKVNLNTGAVTTTSKFTLRIVSMSVAGIPVPVGNACETADPVVATVKSEKGFSILNGGNLGGSYSIGDFANCGLATALINLTIPASGNTITLKLGKATISS